MVLVDTSIWIDHFRKGEPSLVRLLEHDQVLMHPFVRAELACGNLKNRIGILSMLNDLPAAIVASDQEVMKFVERYQLFGVGLGYVDVHLLAATALTETARLWTLDRALLTVAAKLELS